MGILYRLVFLTACPGTHHKLAMDALRHLRCPDADGWRDLFLNYYEPYLRGAKAPDNEFKDFQNHVLHVRDNYWGGAIRTSQLWYERLVLALRRQYWSDAVYTAGILSHYFTDPMMPFHTGQTEEEGKVHRAAEWSISKCYEEFQEILEVDQGGYPNIIVPEGKDWLERLIKQGAELANTHYDALIDHYDLARGIDDPPSGLDQECKDRIAQMIGFAAVGFARVLEKAFVEAGSCPPMCELVVETVLATMKMPARWVLQKLEDEDEIDLLEAIYEEAERTGKVIENLPDDEKFVRKLHAHQVLKIPLSELDAQPVRPTGLHHGHGTPDRTSTPGFLARWFNWDFSLFDWFTDDDRPKFVPPVPVAKGGVGMGTTLVRHAAPGTLGATRSPLSSTVRSRRRSGGRPATRHTGRSTAAPARRARRDDSHEFEPTNYDSTPLDDASTEQLDAATVKAAEPAAVTYAERDDARRDRRRRGGEIDLPPRNRPQRGSSQRRDEPPPEDDEPTDPPESQDSPDDESAEADAATENQPTRRARMGQAIRGVASRVWQGATSTASRMKRFVPRFKRSKSAVEESDAANSETDAESDTAQRLVGDDSGAGSSSGSTARALKFYLERDSDVEAAPSIGAKTARRLETLGVKTVEDLLDADADKIAAKMGQKHITGETIRQWQAQSELMCRVPQLRGHDAQILVASGVTDPDDLAAMDPASLFELIEPFLGTREAESILRGSSPPDLNEVADWIDWAHHARPGRAS